jgi:hypothetical protein
MSGYSLKVFFPKMTTNKMLMFEVHANAIKHNETFAVFEVHANAIKHNETFAVFCLMRNP